MRLNLDRIKRARASIDSVFLNTPQYECGPLGEALGCRVFLKVETLNPIRCFKGRGADLALDRIARKGPGAAVVCASAGNLGQAVAYSAARRKMSAIVYTAQNAEQVKLDRIRALGAEVRIVEGDFELARATARSMADAGEAILIEDSENIGTCEGAATLALELIELAEQPEIVIVSLGGGAMATGVGLVMKSLAPGTEVITVQAAEAPALTLSYRAGRVVTTETMDTIADGVAGRFPIAEVLDDLLEVADEAVLVSEESIKRGMAYLYLHAGLVTEPAAALGVAAVLENPGRFNGRRVATIICGANVDPHNFRAWAVEPGAAANIVDVSANSV